MPGNVDAIVVGGGILGLATARQLLLDRPGLRLLLLEKEHELARHQTGHNSGVVHSGVYYAPGSLKARLCREGKAELERFADDHGIPHRPRGKLIVALDESELPRLAELERRARANGVEGLRVLEGAELREVEPHVTGIRALHAPHTGVIDYRLVANALADDVRAAGGEIRTGTEVEHVDDLDARIVVACCGLQADRVARARDVRIVPFRGDYYTLRPQAAKLVRGLIYPVPDPRFPFLGVHFTRHVDDTVAAGPNAVLALHREGYRRTAVSLRDAAATFGYAGFWRFAARHLRTGAAEVWRDSSRRAFLRDMQRYLPELRDEDVQPGPTGIRAQAVTPAGRLVDDFLIVRRGRATHVVNAPSPAATSALAIARHIVAQL